MEVADNRRIETLKQFLPGYKGATLHDSYAGWFHIGTDRQMCMGHQAGLPKKEIKCTNTKGDVLEFLTEVKRAGKQYHAASKVEDPHTWAAIEHML